ncbi:MAG: benzoyl-CoA-dihydrodiol lyase, partial [Blastocatellia bacterium]|nr:benzoyl-CoA-dihydrodiol lyase [Blastocatellia bacterium]
GTSPSVEVAITEMNAGLVPMGNGLTRLETKLLGEAERVASLLKQTEPFTAEQAEEAGLVTLAVDELDWEDDIRVATEERA